MALKRKERPLTREEMITRGGIERAGQWLHGTPQFMALPSSGGPEFFPLAKTTQQNTFIVYMGEATDPELMPVFEAFRLINQRYVELPFSTGFVITPRYPFALKKTFYSRFEPYEEFKECFLWLDPTQEMNKAFSIPLEPTLVVFTKGREFKRFELRGKNTEWSHDLESALQTILKTDDPGIPLPRIAPMEIPTAHAVEMRPLREGLSGPWVPHLGGALSSGPGCKINVSIEGTGALLILDLDKAEQAGGRILVRWNGENVPERESGAQLKFGLQAQTLVEINHSSGVYEILKSSDEPLSGNLELEVIEPTDFPVLYFGLMVLKT